MATLNKAIEALGERGKGRLLRKHKVKTVPQLVNHYRQNDRENGGWSDFVRELKGQELRKSLTVLDDGELKAVVFGALAFADKAKILIPGGGEVGNLRMLRGIMKDLCGWSVETFQQATYDAVIEMLNRVGVDVEERQLEQLEQAGGRAADRKVRLRRMFAD